MWRICFISIGPNLGNLETVKLTANAPWKPQQEISIPSIIFQVLLMEEFLHQLIAIPLFSRFYTSQVVVWDFWTINSTVVLGRVTQQPTLQRKRSFTSCRGGGTIPGWWFQIVGEMIQFDLYFSDGLVQPPTRFKKGWLSNSHFLSGFQGHFTPTPPRNNDVYYLKLKGKGIPTPKCPWFNWKLVKYCISTLSPPQVELFHPSLRITGFCRGPLCMESVETIRFASRQLVACEMLMWYHWQVRELVFCSIFSNWFWGKNMQSPNLWYIYTYKTGLVQFRW